MPDPIRNRIKSHRRVRAGDLVPHEWNFRLHPEQQKAALEALYREVGFARSHGERVKLYGIIGSPLDLDKCTGL